MPNSTGPNGASAPPVSGNYTAQPPPQGQDTMHHPPNMQSDYMNQPMNNHHTMYAQGAPPPQSSQPLPQQQPLL